MVCATFYRVAIRLTDITCGGHRSRQKHLIEPLDWDNREVEKGVQLEVIVIKFSIPLDQLSPLGH